MREDREFNFSAAMRGLCGDICSRLDGFGHVDMSRVVVAVTPTRSRRRGGVLARLTPLRFEGGELTTRRHGRQWTIQRVFDGEREMLYILTFYLPRFANQSFDEKFTTVMHELYHVNPSFNGEIRRVGERYHAHGRCCREFDAQMRQLAQRYRQSSPPREVWEFLGWDWRQLAQRFGGVTGLRIAVPKLLPLDAAASEADGASAGAMLLADVAAVRT